MLRKFASLAHPGKYGYAYDSEAFDTRAQIEDHFRQFETYGDGLCQHSSDWSITPDFFADYLASLAVALLDEEKESSKDGAERDLLERVSFSLMRRPSEKEIAFAASLIYKEGKTRYYSMEEMKVSSNPEKEHDKRYQRITDVHDGSAQAIYRTLIPEYHHGLQAFQWAHAIREWTIAESNRPYMELSGEFLNWTKDRHAALAMRDAFEACVSLIESYSRHQNAERCIENYRRNLPVQEEVSSNG